MRGGGGGGRAPNRFQIFGTLHFGLLRVEGRCGLLRVEGRCDGGSMHCSLWCV